jgi:hypothetical protein
MVLRVVARVLAGRQRGLPLRRWCQAYLIGKPTKSGALSVFAGPAVGSSGLRPAESGLLGLLDWLHLLFLPAAVFLFKS